MISPTYSVTREQVIASLEATGSSDPEVLAAAKEVLEERAETQRRAAIGCIAVACVAATRSLGIVAGLFLTAIGVWGWVRAARNSRAIEEGFAAFMRCE